MFNQKPPTIIVISSVKTMQNVMMLALKLLKYVSLIFFSQTQFHFFNLFAFRLHVSAESVESRERFDVIFLLFSPSLVNW